MEVIEVKLDDVIVKDRFRKAMGNLDDLSESIKAKGIIQPVTIDPENRLVAGGRRIAAARLAGLETIPCLVRELEDEVDRLEIELFENKHRKDMTWVEEVEITAAIHAMMKKKKGNWGQRRTAKLLDVTQPRIQQRLQMHQAILVVPELAQCPNEEEARRKLKKMMERAVVQEALETVETDREEKAGLTKLNIEWASEGYVIGDALKLIKKVRAGSWHFAEVDPPYGINLHEKKSKGSAGIEYYNEISTEEYPQFLADICKGVYRALAENTWCVWWCGSDAHKQVEAYDALIKAKFKVDPIPAIWFKESSSSVSNVPDIYLGRSYETFFICRKGTPTLRKRGRSNVFSFKAVNPKSKRHPTERPVALISDILETFIYPGARVLVPFLGSGATLLAAWKAGFNVYGFEISEEYKEGFLVEALELMEELRQIKDNVE